MSLESRQDLIRRIEAIRQSKVICYLTTLRPGVPGQMADDAVRVFFDHLLLLPSRPVEKVDIFLCSLGGSGTMPWRLTALLREFAKSFNVLIPYRAYSAASLLALGADEIVMHPFGEMGPIDPSVSNDYNPVEGGTGRRLSISVEDVKAFVGFIKETVGIRHEDELVRAVEILVNKVHPLALGNVERFLSQSRMIARKILRTHMSPERGEHEIEEIIENMASKLYFHGHPINRKEAKEELKLKVNMELPAELETAMWDLYKEFEEAFETDVMFRPGDELSLKAWPVGAAFFIPPGAPGAPPTPFHPIIPSETVHKLAHAFVESEAMSSRYMTERRYLLVGLGQNLEPLIREDVIAQGWDHSRAQKHAKGGRPSQK